MDFEEWHDKQLNGDRDNCPHEAWEKKAWEAATKAEREAKAAAWERAHGFDKHGVAEWLRSNKQNSAAPEASAGMPS